MASTSTIPPETKELISQIEGILHNLDVATRKLRKSCLPVEEIPRIGALLDTAEDRRTEIVANDDSDYAEWRTPYKVQFTPAPHCRDSKSRPFLAACVDVDEKVSVRGSYKQAMLHKETDLTLHLDEETSMGRVPAESVRWKLKLGKQNDIPPPPPGAVVRSSEVEPILKTDLQRRNRSREENDEVDETGSQISVKEGLLNSTLPTWEPLLDPNARSIPPSATLLQPLPDHPPPSRVDAFEYALQLRLTRMALTEHVEGAERAEVKWTSVYDWIAERKGSVSETPRSLKVGAYAYSTITAASGKIEAVSVDERGPFHRDGEEGTADVERPRSQGERENQYKIEENWAWRRSKQQLTSQTVELCAGLRSRIRHHHRPERPVESSPAPPPPTSPPVQEPKTNHRVTSKDRLLSVHAKGAIQEAEAFQTASFLFPDDVSAAVHMSRIYLDSASDGDVDMDKADPTDGLLGYITRSRGWNVPEAWYYLAKAYGL
ncbi:hypothetical protein F5J12DRAFT_927063 [Pisolithus orientalis]|uniref:uncharacterized protein n=1 Tax=Pisolithus orientalis TaxID=936130 RepID=UPI002224C426|nr:uncharacterized protein F5J12DRAFT_927063 [Pisolithus orientalis]KAI6008917.1 hypothetical protein F5J12DRAFT_927063 [Pisolithus orientalis]